MNKVTSTLFATAVLFAICGIATPTYADTLVIPLGAQATDRLTPMPQRGQLKGTVIQRHGEPARRHAPVGQPPITRWDYSDFSVYFEYDHVIDSVRHRHAGTVITP